MKEQNLKKYNHILAVGGLNLKKRLLKALNTLAIDIKYAHQQDTRSKINENTVALIIDEEVVDHTIKDFISSICIDYKFLPVFYLNRTRKEAGFHKDLYSLGVMGVFNWPVKDKLLLDVVTETLKPHPNASGYLNGDKNLANMLKSKIMVLDERYQNIQIKSKNMVVSLKGKVPTLYDRALIMNEVAASPGLTELKTRALKVKSDKKVTDREIQRKIKVQLGILLGEEKKNIIVKVKRSKVFLIGTTSDYEKTLSLKEFVMKLDGVKSVEQKIILDPDLTQKRVKKIKSIENKVKNVFKGVRHISISLFGDFLEISGVVGVKEDKKLIENYLIQSLDASRVSNQLIVSS